MTGWDKGNSRVDFRCRISARWWVVKKSSSGLGNSCCRFPPQNFRQMITTRNSRWGCPPFHITCFCRSASDTLAYGIYRPSQESGSHHVRDGWSPRAREESIHHEESHLHVRPPGTNWPSTFVPTRALRRLQRRDSRDSRRKKNPWVTSLSEFPKLTGKSHWWHHSSIFSETGWWWWLVGGDVVGDDE